MPAMLDDPSAPTIYRVSGEAPYPQPGETTLPENIFPKQVTLRDRITTATLLPCSTASHVPRNLLTNLCETLNKEIEIGDTYPMMETMSVEAFGKYWFQNFGAIMVMGDVDSLASLAEMESSGADWSKLCLGSFYVKPNYPGRSSHVCNGGFIVTDAARNKGVGRLMGEGYLEWAPRLGYIYSVFNLVYENNVASCRIWDALGFKRIGRVKGAGALRSNPDEMTDAIIYGRDLGPEGEDFVSEERFDKIRYYLKHSKYPAGADRAEKSRLRSAATHYKLIPSPDGGEERLMLKDKEVVADPQRQYEIARLLHAQTHGGINKTTASIAERYHWVRIKETVSLVIKNCPECKETSKIHNLPRDAAAGAAAAAANGRKAQNTGNNSGGATHDPNRDIERLVNLDHSQPTTNNAQSSNTEPSPRRPARRSIAKQEPGLPVDNVRLEQSQVDNLHYGNPQPEQRHDQNISHQQAIQQQQHQHQPQQQHAQHQVQQPHQQHQPHQQTLQQHPMQHQQAPVAQMHSYEMPLDPQIISYNPHRMTSDAMAHALENQHLSHPSLSHMNTVDMAAHGLPPMGNSGGMGKGYDSGMQKSYDGSMQHAVDGQLQHSMDQSMQHSSGMQKSFDSSMQGVQDNNSIQHPVNQPMGGQMHVNMMGMGQNGFNMGLGPQQHHTSNQLGGVDHTQGGLGVGTVGGDERMDDGHEVVDSDMDRHLMEAGFGGQVGHGGN